MNDDSPHPSLEQLAAFDSGQLHAAEWDDVERHVAQCATCCSKLDILPEDSFAALLKVSAGKSTPPPDSETMKAPDRIAARPLDPPGHAARAAALEVPRELAAHTRYRILEPLGAGGMGTVFKAEHRLMERVVALKIIRRDLMDWPAAVERFRQEVKAAARLLHPHIVTAYDAEQAGEVHFLVMEFVEGQSLDRLLRCGAQVSVAQACDWIRQAALGLQHAWERGMVHRDIKPANLLLTSAGQVKILDFGLARFANEAASAAGLTPVGSMLGTPDYMAPEQAAAAGSADTRADIYSLGCTLYHLLAGKPPFPEGAPLHKLLFHQNREARPLSELRDDVPMELEQVVQRMLAKDPAQRYQTPAEVARDLAPFVAEGWQTAPLGQGSPRTPRLQPPGGQAPPVAEPQPRAAGLSRFAGRSWLFATATALLFIAAGLLGPVVWHVPRQDSPQPSSDGPGTKQEPLIIVGPPEVAAAPALPESATTGEIRCIGGKNGKFTRVAFAPDCRRALAAGTDFALQLWDLDKGQQMARLEGHTADILGVGFSPDGKRALSGSQDLPGIACLWDLEERRLLKTLKGHRSWVRGVAFLPDERYALTGSNDATLIFWDLTKGLPMRPFKGHVHVVGGVAVSRFGRFFASSGWDKTVRVWDMVDNEQIHVYRGHEGPVPTVVYSRCGRYLLSGSEDKTLRLWDVEAEKELRCFKGHTAPVNCVALLPDNRWALSGSADGTVRLWDVERGQELCRLDGHTAPVQGVAFCPSGMQAVSGSEDGTFRFWQLPR